MTRPAAALAPPALLLALCLGPPAASAQDPAKGKAVYEAAAPKCKMCHSIDGVGNAKGSLDGVGAKLKPDEIKAWIRDSKAMATKAKASRKPPMVPYPAAKISDADLEHLAAYLSTLKKK